MQRFAWKAKLLPGKKSLYKKYHDEIWPEMTQMLNEAKIHNYTIWCDGENLFGYYECSDIEFATKIQSQSEVVGRWNVAMQECMKMDFDEKTGVTPPLELMFFHK